MPLNSPDSAAVGDERKSKIDRLGKKKHPSKPSCGRLEMDAFIHLELRHGIIVAASSSASSRRWPDKNRSKHGACQPPNTHDRQVSASIDQCIERISAPAWGVPVMTPLDFGAAGLALQ